MSYAPATLRELEGYLATRGVVPLGIVGNAAHVSGYHLGRDRIYDGSGPGLGDADYSVRLARDQAGLTNGAAAIDLGRVDGSLTGLQRLSRALVAACQAGAPGASDVREIIYSPDGVAVQRWSGVDRGIHTGPGNGDSSHRAHTHVSYYRDSERRSKLALFAALIAEVDMSVTRVKLEAWTARGPNGCARLRAVRGDPVAIRLPLDAPIRTVAEVLAADPNNPDWRISTLGAFRASGATIVDAVLRAAPDGTPLYLLRSDYVPAVQNGDPALDATLADLVRGVDLSPASVLVTGFGLSVSGPG